MNELTPNEWNWLQAYRNQFGLPEDRLRFYLSVMTSCITAAMSLSGTGYSTQAVLGMMNPYPDQDGATPEEKPQIVSPNQGAAMFSAAVNAARQ